MRCGTVRGCGSRWRSPWFACGMPPGIAATLRGLADFVTHPGYGMMCAGLLCILVFSRLFGMSVLWQTLMLDGYNRVVKNMVEEGCELLGYGLCLLATLSYMKTVFAPDDAKA